MVFFWWIFEYDHENVPSFSRMIDSNKLNHRKTERSSAEKEAEPFPIFQIVIIFFDRHSNFSIFVFALPNFLQRGNFDDLLISTFENDHVIVPCYSSNSSNRLTLKWNKLDTAHFNHTAAAAPAYSICMQISFFFLSRIWTGLKVIKKR